MEPDRSHAVDAHLREALQREPPPETPWALVALGGYARREMAPHSDIDIQFLTDDPVALEAFVTRCLHGWWDAGLKLGYATRDAEETLSLAAESLETATALMDARLVGGSESLFQRLQARLADEVFGPQREALFDALCTRRARRHARFGDTVYLLEPDVKSGEGGLRDLHGARWAARLVRGDPDGSHPRGQLGISAREREVVNDAYRTLRLFRRHLHEIAGRRVDRLYFAHQDELARRLGASTIEEAMQRYWLAAAQVRALTRRVLDQLELELGRAPADMVEAVGLIGPAQAVALFRRSSETGWPLHPQALQAAAEAVSQVDDSTRDDRSVSDDLLAILTCPGDRARPLTQMHEIGLLAALLPELEPLTGLYQHNVFHVYTVDHHTLAGVAELKRLREPTDCGPSAAHPAAVMASLRPADLQLLTVAFLLHDMGKGGVNPRRAGSVARRLGLSPTASGRVGLLVREHLLMALLAQTRDIHDETTLRHLAREVGDRRTLAMLYLVTWADMSSANPELLTGWKADLLRELFERTDRLLEGGLDVFGDDGRVVHARRGEVLRLVLGADPPDHPTRETREVDRFIGALPTRYCVVCPAETITAHMALCRTLAGRRVALSVDAVSEQTSRITVCCRDTPGLLSRLSGAFASHRVNIIGAEVFGRTDGIVIDVFDVQAPVPWEALSADLERVVLREVATDDLIRRRERPSPIGEPAAPPVATQVSIDNFASTTKSVVDVVARDRPGLLYRVTRVLHRLGLDIALARVTTEGHTARDAFYVEWVSGGKVVGLHRKRVIERVAEAISGPL